MDLLPIDHGEAMQGLRSKTSGGTPEGQPASLINSHATYPHLSRPVAFVLFGHGEAMQGLPSKTSGGTGADGTRLVSNRGPLPSGIYTLETVRSAAWLVQQTFSRNHLIRTPHPNVISHPSFFTCMTFGHKKSRKASAPVPPSQATP